MFPPSYRQFLLELGCGDVAGFEVYGLVDEDFVDSAVPDAIWLTLEERRSSGLDPRYVVIGALGDGTYDCLDTAHVDAAGEAPVVQLSADFEDPVKLADSFGEYFLTEVEERALRRRLIPPSRDTAGPVRKLEGRHLAPPPGALHVLVRASAGGPAPAPSGCRAGR